MHNEKLQFSDTKLGKIYNEGNGVAEAAFYVTDYDSAIMRFKIDGQTAVPVKIITKKSKSNVGEKINIEVVANGYIIKNNGNTLISDSEWDLKSKIEKIITGSDSLSFVYDETEHHFNNLSDVLDEFEATL